MRSHPHIFAPLALSLLLIPASTKTEAAVASTLSSTAETSPQGIPNQVSVAETLTTLGKQMAATGNAALALQLFDRAVKIGQTIEDTSSKINVLSTIALQLAEARQTQKSKQLFEQTVQLTKRRNENFSLYDQDPALRDIVIKVAQAGFTERALQLTKTISSNYRKAEALNGIAPILAKKGQIEPAKKLLLEALQKARGITGDYAYESNGSCGNDKFDVMSKIATNLSSLAQFNQALQVAKSIENCSSANGEGGAYYQTSAFLGILENSANTAQTKQTWTTAKTVKDAEVWSAIAVKLAGMGETNLALSVASNISTQIPLTTKIDSGYALRIFGQKENALRKIAIKLAEVGKFEPALQVAQMIPEPTEEDQKANEPYIGKLKPTIKTLTLVEITRQLAKAKQIEPAVKRAASIQDQEGQALAMIAIAQELQKTGQAAPAKELLSKNLRLPEISPNNDFNANQSIINIAAALVPVGQIEQALQIANSLKDDSNKQEALTKISIQLVEIGQVDRALQIANSLKDDSNKQEVLTKISIQLVEIGQVDRALQIAKTLTYAGYKDQAFSTIAAKFIELGQLDRALQVTQLLEDDSKANMLADIANSFAKIKQTQRALQVAETLPSKELKAYAIANIAAKIPK